MFSEFFYYYNQDNQDENLQKSPKWKQDQWMTFNHNVTVFVFKIQTKSEVELTIKPEIEEGGRPLRAVLGLIPWNGSCSWIKVVQRERKTEIERERDWSSYTRAYIVTSWERERERKRDWRKWYNCTGTWLSIFIYICLWIYNHHSDKTFTDLTLMFSTICLLYHVCHRFIITEKRICSNCISVLYNLKDHIPSIWY